MFIRRQVTSATPPVRCRTGLTVLAAALVLTSAVAGAQGPSCNATGKGMALAGIPEASGAAASRKTPGHVWSHNDSGEPVLFAISADGAVTGRVRVAGAGVEDWEDMSVGPCPQGSCVYVGDIGDNNGKRSDITIYRVPEPEASASTSATAESMRATYPDGAQDAEALFVLPDGAVYIVTKGERGPIGLYRAPSGFQKGTTVKLERVATVTAARAGDKDAIANEKKVTGASASADGRWIALRTTDAIAFYAASELTAGKVREVFRYDVKSLGEPQGEGVAFAADGVVWLTSEGGGKDRPGTLTRLECTLR